MAMIPLNTSAALMISVMIVALLLVVQFLCAVLIHTTSIQRDHPDTEGLLFWMNHVAGTAVQRALPGVHRRPGGTLLAIRSLGLLAAVLVFVISGIGYFADSAVGLDDVSVPSQYFGRHEMPADSFFVCAGVCTILLVIRLLLPSSRASAAE